MTSACVRRRALGVVIGLTLMFYGAMAAPALAEQIVVNLDRARLIKLPERAATVVIGDPLIADLSLQPGGLAVITAKGYGATNLIVLDREGAVLSEHTLEVKGPIDPTVVVYRGVKQEPIAAPRNARSGSRSATTTTTSARQSSSPPHATAWLLPPAQNGMRVAKVANLQARRRRSNRHRIHEMGNAVVDLICSIAKRDVTFFNGTALINRL